MRSKCCQCGAACRGLVRTAALGIYVYLCPDCREGFDAAMAAPVDLALRCLDREAHRPAPWRGASFVADLYGR